MEVTISMLITGILIVMTYTVYNIVVKTYHGYNDKQANSAVLLRIDELLRDDFRRAEKIFTNQNHIIMQRGETQVDYNIESNYIVRSTEIVDSFKVNTIDVIKSFEGDLANQDAGPQVIDELQLNVLYDNKTFPYHYRKQYSATNLIKITQ